HVVLGYNSRLDTIQAAVLRVKLKYLDQWNKMRRYNARLYDEFLKDARDIIKPFTSDYSGHVYHIYAVRVKNRKKIISCLQANGIGVMVNYPIPLHLQPAYRGLGYQGGDFPVAEMVCREIVSLPMYPLLTKKEIKYVVSVLKK
ncbi:MAG: DegT/DnrJ/EryC1/StrS family aminotransferase, partial [bacterium]